jgi:DivIVA domain-containing protein
MVLTPADVHNVAFSRPRIGKRGYDEQEVDLFIDLVEQELIRHLEQEGELRGRSAKLRSRYGELQGREAELCEREVVLAQHESELHKQENHESELHKQENEVRQQQARLAQRVAQLGKRTAPIPQQLAQLRDREAQVAQREAQLARHEAELAQQEGELAEREGELAQQEGELAQREGELARWENELRQQEAELHRRLDERQAVTARAGADAASRQVSRVSGHAQQLRVVPNSATVNGAPRLEEMHTVASMHGRHDMERMAIRAVTDTLGNVVTETVHERTRRSPRDDGGAGVPSEQAGEIERLKEENAELNRSLRLLKSAAALLAAALDHP